MRRPEYQDEAYRSAKEMIEDMERHLHHMSNYSMWKIGIARRPDHRCEDMGNPSFWCDWEAHSEDVAREARDWFIAKGMQPDESEKGGMFVYIC
jgi:hypothetical protein